MTDFGDSSNGRLYTRLEDAFMRGLDRIEGKMVTLSEDVVKVRERMAAVDEKMSALDSRITGVGELRKEINDTKTRIGRIENQLAEQRGKDRLVAAGMGLGAAGLMTLLVRWLGNLFQTGVGP